MCLQNTILYLMVGSEPSLLFLGDKLKVKIILVLSVLLAIILSNVSVVSVVATTKLSGEREITIIEKRVCFNVTIGSSIDNETVTKKICVIVKFHVINARPSDATMNITFPVYINIGNRTVEKTVVVPLKIKGEVSKIEVYPAGKESIISEPENVIIVVPEEKTQTTTTTTPKPTPTTTTSKPKTTTTPKTTQHKTTTSKKTKTSTAGVKPEKVLTLPMPKRNETKTSIQEVFTIIGIVLVFIGAGLGAYYFLKRKREKKVEKERRQPEEVEDLESYREALKMMKQQLEEKEKELRALKSSFTYKIYCPKCKEPVTPIKTHDNRFICPKCNTLLGKIRSDGTLDIFPLKNREKNERGSKREDEKTGKVSRGNNEETAGSDEGD